MIVQLYESKGTKMTILNTSIGHFSDGSHGDGFGERLQRLESWARRASHSARVTLRELEIVREELNTAWGLDCREAHVVVAEAMPDLYYFVVALEAIRDSVGRK